MIARTAQLTAEVSERRRTEEVLRESEERFRAFMDNSPAIAFIKDRDGCYVYLNKLFENHFGLKLSDCAGKTDFDIWPPELAAVDAQQRGASSWKRARRASLLKSSRCRAAGARSGSSGNLRSRDRDGAGFVGGVGVDLTERNRLEAGAASVAKARGRRPARRRCGARL